MRKANNLTPANKINLSIFVLFRKSRTRYKAHTLYIPDGLINMIRTRLLNGQSSSIREKAILACIIIRDGLLVDWLKDGKHLTLER